MVEVGPVTVLGKAVSTQVLWNCLDWEASCLKLRLETYLWGLKHVINECRVRRMEFGCGVKEILICMRRC